MPPTVVAMTNIPNRIAHARATRSSMIARIIRHPPADCSSRISNAHKFNKCLPCRLPDRRAPEDFGLRFRLPEPSPEGPRPDGDWGEVGVMTVYQVEMVRGCQELHKDGRFSSEHCPRLDSRHLAGSSLGALPIGPGCCSCSRTSVDSAPIGRCHLTRQ